MSFRFLVYACVLGVAPMAAQTPDGKPTFDVASIKPTPPPPAGGRGRGMMMQGGPGSKDPELYRCNNCNLPMLIMKAYKIEFYQLTTPSWMETLRFDVTARVPAGATEEQFRLMLQNLLADRFKLAIHRDRKDAQVYDLVIAKSGLKIKEAVEEPAKDGDADVPLPVLGRGGGRGPNLDKDGYPIIPKGCNGCMMVINGKARLHLEKETMQGFAEMLSSQLSKPVTDATGLKGKYDFDVPFEIEGMLMGPGRGGLPLPPGGGSSPFPGGNSPLVDSDLGVPIIAAVQSQLGLKLESKKGQVEMIVVDHAEKVPTEN